MEKKSRWPRFVFALAVLAGIAWLVVRNQDQIEVFAEGITGNQALGEKNRIEEQLNGISDERNRQLEEVMGH